MATSLPGSGSANAAGVPLSAASVGAKKKESHQTRMSGQPDVVDSPSPCPPSSLRRSPSTALKNYEKWRKVQRHALRPLAGLLAMKLPYGAAPQGGGPLQNFALAANSILRPGRRWPPTRAYDQPTTPPLNAADEAKLVDSHCIRAMKTEFPALGLVLDLQVNNSNVRPRPGCIA